MKRSNPKDWSSTPRLRAVRLIIDPRHEGEVVLSTTLMARVRWSNGWKSDHRHDELEDA